VEGLERKREVREKLNCKVCNFFFTFKKLCNALNVYIHVQTINLCHIIIAVCKYFDFSHKITLYSNRVIFTDYRLQHP